MTIHRTLSACPYPHQFGPNGTRLCPVHQLCLAPAGTYDGVEGGRPWCPVPCPHAQPRPTHRPAECWCGGTHGSVAKPDAWDLLDAMGWWAIVVVVVALAALGIRKAASRG